MISEYTKSDTSKILHIINDASLRYKGIIPDNCWHDPYMSEQKLVKEFNAGVCMYGYHQKNKNSRLLVGTWRNAIWAIRFYEKFGFIPHSDEQSTLLLKKYWKIPSQQIENSIVLER